MTLLLEKLAFFIAKHNKKISLIWLISVLLCVFYLYKNPDQVFEDELRGATNTEAYRVEQIVKNDFGISQESSLAVVIEGKDEKGELKELLEKSFSEFNGVIEVKSPKKHKNTFYYIRFKPEVPIRTAQAISGDVRKKTSEWSKKTGIKTYLTGDSAFFYDTSHASKKDSSKNEIIALILSFFILIRTFGGFLSSFLPIVAGATTMIYLNTMVRFFSLQANTVSLILNSLIGLGLAIDYSLFIISRFNEEKNSKSHQESLKESLIYSGKTIFFSSLIMAFCISVIYLPDVSSSRIVVKNIIMVVIVSCIVALLFVPALAYFCRNYLDKPKVISDYINKRNSYIFWKKYSNHITNYPKSYFLLSALILFLICFPVFSMKIWEPVQTMTPKDSESRMGYDALVKDNWGGELLPVIVTVKSDEIIFSEKNIGLIYDLTNYIKKNTGVTSILSLTSLNENMSKKEYQNFYLSAFSSGMLFFNDDIKNLVNVNSDSKTAIIYVYVNDVMNVKSTKDVLEYCRKFENKNQEVEILAGGVVARAKDFSNELYRPVKEIFLIITIGIFIILYIYMKTPILPIKAAIMNFLPITSSFGVLTAVFQFGYFGSILGTPHNEGVSAIVPVVLFCVIFGLSMDYEVLILSRITENYNKTGNVKESIVEGLAKSSSIITGAGLILLSVFIPGIFSSSPIVQEMCLGIASAIFIDTTVVRLLLVPSFMMLMGKYNWWNFKS
ncbi:MAG: MMPL family transporter [Candidatus Sericytochromatia bacterium]